MKPRWPAVVGLLGLLVPMGWLCWEFGWGRIVSVPWWAWAQALGMVTAVTVWILGCCWLIRRYTR